ncbi:MAG: hypothetical protein AAF548_14865 [Actinomycetota bacterium]
MTWTLLLPAAMTALCLVVLAWSMQRVDAELAALRASLRRSRAAAVATDDLRHTTRDVVDEIGRLEAGARARAERRRARQSTPRR